MAQELILSVNGLVVDPSQLRISNGDLDEADNIVIDRKNTASSRRGFKKYSGALTGKIKSIFEYSDRLIAHHGDTLSLDNGSGIFTSIGSVTSPDDKIGMRAEKMQGNFYFTTGTGVKKLESLTSGIMDTGTPRALGLIASLTGSSGFFTDDRQVAYRVCWTRVDANDNLLIGSPSERAEIANSAGATRNVSLTVEIPDGITTDHKCQIYRSLFSASAAYVANDELYLAYEYDVSSAEITAKSFTFVDTLTEDQLGATLYTSQSQEGIALASERPPIAAYLAQYRGHLWYANTRTPWRLEIQIITVGSTTGINIDDTITINDIGYDGKATESIADAYFDVYTSGTAAQNCEQTAKSLVRVINGHAANTEIRAYYISGVDDSPGKILLERYAGDDLPFSVIYTSDGSGYDGGDGFIPVLPSSGVTVSATNSIIQNRIYFSKFHEPESVPAPYYYNIGSKNSAIIAIHALRDALLIFKDDGKIYIISGDDPNSFSVREMNNTAQIYGHKTAAILSNVVIANTTEGIIAFNDSNKDYLSSQKIDKLIKPYNSVAVNPDFLTDCNSTAYESDHKYIFSSGSEMYIYNVITNSWTRWPIAADCLAVNPVDDKLYIGKPNGYIYKERKLFDGFDEADDDFDVTIASNDVYTVTLADATGVEVGQTIRQGTSYAKITGIDGDVLTVDEILAWEAAAAQIYTPIKCSIRWTPILGDNPSILKRFLEATIFFNDINNSFTAYFSNNFNNVEFELLIENELQGAGFGEDTFGDVFGGVDHGSSVTRVGFPIDYMRALWAQIKIETEESFTQFECNGLAVKYDAGSTRFGKGGRE